MTRRIVAWIDGALVVIGASVVTVLVSLVVFGRLLEPEPGGWAMPLRLGPPALGVRVETGVTPVLRLATHPLGRWLLDGRAMVTRYGTLRFSRVDDDRFAIDCRPCRLQLPALGSAPLELDAVRITVDRRADALQGTIVAGAITGRYTGRLDARGIQLDLRFDRAPIADWYRIFGANVPEASFARIAGSAALVVRVELPSATVRIEPAIEGFAVSGLGTERLAGRLPAVSCGVVPGNASIDPSGNASRTGKDFGSWLPRAVIAAEDQRYYEHPGYDLDELRSSLDRNQAASRIARGGSTIPQQLAKLLQVGSDRTAARKLRELLYAVEMERTLGKARMLQLYLAVVPWGDGTCGADAAAKRYFNVPVARLGAAQAVWLAAMLHAPDREAARWSSAGHVDLARARWIVSGMQGVGRGAKVRMLDALAVMQPPDEPAPLVLRR